MIARFVCFLILSGSLFGQQSSQPSLTIYNQNFAVVRQQLPLDLKSGENQVNVNDITMHLEPDSVILRDPTGKHAVRVLEQNYRADPVSQTLLLSLYEGKTIDFEVGTTQGTQTIKGKVVCSGYVPLNESAMNLYGQQYYQSQMAAGSEQPIIEVAPAVATTSLTAASGRPANPLKSRFATTRKSLWTSAWWNTSTGQ